MAASQATLAPKLLVGRQALRPKTDESQTKPLRLRDVHGELQAKATEWAGKVRPERGAEASSAPGGVKANSDLASQFLQKISLGQTERSQRTAKEASPRTKEYGDPAQMLYPKDISAQYTQAATILDSVITLLDRIFPRFALAKNHLEKLALNAAQVTMSSPKHQELAISIHEFNSYVQGPEGKALVTEFNRFSTNSFGDIFKQVDEITNEITRMLSVSSERRLDDELILRDIRPLAILILDQLAEVTKGILAVQKPAVVSDQHVGVSMLTSTPQEARALQALEVNRDKELPDGLPENVQGQFDSIHSAIFHKASSGHDWSLAHVVAEPKPVKLSENENRLFILAKSLVVAYNLTGAAQREILSHVKAISPLLINTGGSDIKGEILEALRKLNHQVSMGKPTSPIASMAEVDDAALASLDRAASDITIRAKYQGLNMSLDRMDGFLEGELQSNYAQMLKNAKIKDGVPLDENQQRLLIIAHNLITACLEPDLSEKQKLVEAINKEQHLVLETGAREIQGSILDALHILTHKGLSAVTQHTEHSEV